MQDLVSTLTNSEFKNQKDYYKKVLDRKPSKDENLVEKIGDIIDETILKEVDKEYPLGKLRGGIITSCIDSGILLRVGYGIYKLGDALKYG